MKTIKIKTETGWKEIEISEQSFEENNLSMTLDIKNERIRPSKF